MPVSPTYVAREAITNLWRNRMMTIAGVLTVAVSLSLVGTALLLRQGAASATARWQQGVNAIVWINPSASQAQIAGVRAQITSVPYVQHCAFHTQAQDFAESQRVLPSDLTNEVQLSGIPASFRCVLDNPAEASSLYALFIGRPNIYNVTYPGQQIKTMETVIHVLQWVFVAVALVLLLAAAVLILNTIRMGIFARRREVAVMKLVGATNWFIRLPFMSEGFAQGIAGAAIAVGVVIAVYVGLGLGSARSGIFAQMYVGTASLVGVSVVVGLVGVIVGVLGSAIAVRRFLDV